MKQIPPNFYKPKFPVFDHCDLRYFEPGAIMKPISAHQKKSLEDYLDEIAAGRIKGDEFVDNCPLCEQNEFRCVATRDRYNIPHSTVICSGCGLVFTNPRLTEEENISFYQLHYRSIYTDRSADINIEGFFQSQIRKGEGILKIVNSVTPRAERSKGAKKRVLEVGCGAGGILVPFRDNGWEVTGCDFNESYLAFGQEKGINTRFGDIDSIEAHKFDLVIYSHVLEHVRDVGGELEKISQKLSKDGVLYVEVPSIESIRSEYRGDLLRYLQNAHTFNFSKETLNGFLKKHGFAFLYCDDFIRSVSRKVEREKELTVHGRNGYESAADLLKVTEKIRKNYYFSKHALNRKNLRRIKKSMLSLPKFILKSINKLRKPR